MTGSFIDDALHEGVPVLLLIAYSKYGEKACRLFCSSVIVIFEIARWRDTNISDAKSVEKVKILLEFP